MHGTMLRFWIALFLMANAAALPNRSNSAPGRDGTTFPVEISLCDALSQLGGRRHTASSIDSLGRGMSEHNRSLWAETDSLYRSGSFGPSGSSEARRGARIHFQLGVHTGFDCILEMALPQGSAVRLDESSLAEPFGHVYANYGVYPIHFLVDGLVGQGQFCLSYAFPRSFAGELPVGGELFQAKVEPLPGKNADGTLALRMSMPTALNKTVDLVYEPRLCGRAREVTIIDRGDTLRLQILDHLEGMHVRRAGLHRLGALIAWRSVTRGPQNPQHPRIGSCAYFPHLTLRLPGPLPDIHLDDLHNMDYPMPIFRCDWLAAAAAAPPEWVGIQTGGTLSPWDGIGPRPEILKEWFPDR